MFSSYGSEVLNEMFFLILFSIFDVVISVRRLCLTFPNLIVVIGKKPKASTVTLIVGYSVDMSIV